MTSSTSLNIVAAPPKSSESRARAAATTPAARVSALTMGLSVFVTMLPVTMLVPALKELVALGHGATPFWTHFFQSCNLLGAVAAAPLIAALCNRRSSRVRVAVAALIGDALLLASMSVAPSLAWLLAARFIEGMTHMTALSALMAVAADHADPARRGRTMGVLGACMMFGTAAGTRIGGLIPIAWCFVAAGAIAALGAVFVAWRMRDAAQHSQRQPLSQSLAALRSSSALAIPYAYTFLDRFCVGVIITSFVLFLGDVHGLDHAARSRLLVGFLVPFALLVYPAGRLVDRVGPALPVSLGSAAFGLLFASFGFVPIEWMYVVMIASGVVSAAMFAPTLTLCADLSPPDLRGAAYAGFNAAGSLGFLLGPIIGGLICHFTAGPLGVLGSYRLAFAVAAATQVLVAMLTLPRLLELNRQGRIGKPRGGA